MVQDASAANAALGVSEGDSHTGAVSARSKSVARCRCSMPREGRRRWERNAAAAAAAAAITVEAQHISKSAVCSTRPSIPPYRPYVALNFNAAVAPPEPEGKQRATVSWRVSE